MQKSYDALVCETGEFRMFVYQSDRQQFVEKMTRKGFHVLQGISYV